MSPQLIFILFRFKNRIGYALVRCLTGQAISLAQYLYTALITAVRRPYDHLGPPFRLLPIQSIRRVARVPLGQP